MGKLIDVQHAVCHSSSLTLNFRWIQLVETLARQWPIKIVTIGWSSTEGDGTSDLAASSYPSRLQDTLRNRWPTASVTVVNKGVDEVARFKSDVTAQDPVLVIRRVGTNSVWSDHCVEEVTSAIIRGFGRPSRRKMDIIVMDLQYAPALVTPTRLTDCERMVSWIGAFAKETGVNVFRRFALMRHWNPVDRIPLDQMINNHDGNELHQNDGTYA